MQQEQLFAVKWYLAGTAFSGGSLILVITHPYMHACKRQANLCCVICAHI